MRLPGSCGDSCAASPLPDPESQFRWPRNSGSKTPRHPPYANAQYPHISLFPQSSEAPYFGLESIVPSFVELINQPVLVVRAGRTPPATWVAGGKLIVATPRGEETCTGRSENDEHVLNGVVSGSKGQIVEGAGNPGRKVCRDSAPKRWIK